MFSLIFGGITNLVSGWFSYKKQQQATLQAVEENKQKLALADDKYNSSWELAELANSDKWLRRISFFIFTLPFFIAIFSSADVHHYFAVGLQSIPDWWIKTYVGITGAVWGISSLKNSIISIASAFRK
jgi:hypothetical protein